VSPPFQSKELWVYWKLTTKINNVLMEIARHYLPLIKHCSMHFLGLTMQPCGESCGFVVGFNFLIITFT